MGLPIYLPTWMVDFVVSVHGSVTKKQYDHGSEMGIGYVWVAPPSQRCQWSPTISRWWFQPIWKKKSNWIISPSSGENNNYLKPSTRFVSHVFSFGNPKLHFTSFKPRGSSILGGSGNQSLHPARDPGHPWAYERSKHSGPKPFRKFSKSSFRWLVEPPMLENICESQIGWFSQVGDEHTQFLKPAVIIFLSLRITLSSDRNKCGHELIQTNQQLTWQH